MATTKSQVKKAAAKKPTAKQTSGRQPMSIEHKKRLEDGRNNSRIARLYLEALKRRQPKRGRKRELATVERDLAQAKIDLGVAIANNDVLQELLKTQAVTSLERELANFDTSDADFGRLETEFITIVEAYSKSKGIDYATWRSVGVPASVLKQAGLKP